MSRQRRRSGGTRGWGAACPLLCALLLSGPLGCAKPVCVGELPPRPVPSEKATIQMLEVAPANPDLWEFMAEIDRYLDAIGAPL